MIAYCENSVADGYRNYIKGKKAYDAKEYASAASYFEAAGSIKNAKLLMQSSYYTLGNIDFKNKSYSYAAFYYSKCGKYKNAQQLVYVCKGEQAFKDKDYAHAISNYKKVSKKLKVSGINIKSRKALMNRMAKFESIKGEYSAVSNKLVSMNVFRLYSTYRNWWTQKELEYGQELVLDYKVNSNGTIHLFGYVSHACFYNYSAYSSLVNATSRNITISKNGLKKFPTSIKLDSRTKLKYKKHKFTLTYKKKERESIYSYNVYKSTVVYKK
jgi:tetratricopeptide (TPR) repeat protein